MGPVYPYHQLPGDSRLTPDPRPIEEHRPTILSVATAAHREAQGGKGSGADVAASVLGGTFVFSLTGGIESVQLDGVHTVAVWSGRAASTAELIGKIQAFEARDKATHSSCFDAMEKAAQALAGAYRSGDPKSIIAATSDYGDQMGNLGRASGASIVTPEHKLITQLASDLGGAAKPSGAGGGDVAVAIFDNPEAATHCRSYCLRHGLIPLDISFGAPGLRLDHM